MLECATTTQENVKARLCDEHGAMDYQRLHPALLAGSLAAAWEWLLGSDAATAGSPFQVLPAARRFSADALPPRTVPELQEQYENQWRKLIRRLAKEQISRSPEERIAGQPYFEDGDGASH